MTSEDIWFSGPVKDAVSLVAQRNCVFLVYIYGKATLCYGSFAACANIYNR